MLVEGRQRRALEVYSRLYFSARRFQNIAIELNLDLIDENGVPEWSKERTGEWR